jgi:hypothetical protein
VEPFHGEITVQEDQNVYLEKAKFSKFEITYAILNLGRNNNHRSNTNGMSYN